MGNKKLPQDRAQLFLYLAIRIDAFFATYLVLAYNDKQANGNVEKLSGVRDFTLYSYGQVPNDMPDEQHRCRCHRLRVKDPKGRKDPLLFPESIFGGPMSIYNEEKTWNGLYFKMRNPVSDPGWREEKANVMRFLLKHRFGNSVTKKREIEEEARIEKIRTDPQGTFAFMQ